MDMKINGQLVKSLREERAWSQEQLAQIAGISLRTVQRAEREANASNETRMALAGAFGVLVSDISLSELEAPRQESVSNVSPSWKRRWGAFVLGCGLMLLLNFMNSGAITWAKWPTLIWGLILLYKSLLRSRLFR